jgi:hypothetical protein
MFQFISIVVIALFFISCGSSDTPPVEQKVALQPLEILDIAPHRGTLRGAHFTKNHFVQRYRDNDQMLTLYIGKIAQDGSLKPLSQHKFPYRRRASSFVFSPDSDSFVISRQYMDTNYTEHQNLNLYKIEDNGSVEQYDSIPFPKSKKEDADLGNISYGERACMYNNIVAVPKATSYYDDNDEEARLYNVFMYKIGSDKHLHPIQTLAKDCNSTSGNSDDSFGHRIVMNNDHMVITENCQLHLYTKNSDDTFKETDSYIVNDGKSRWCDLYPKLDSNDILSVTTLRSGTYLAKIKNDKIVNMNRVFSYSSRYNSRPSYFVNHKLVNKDGTLLKIYNVVDSNDTLSLQLQKDINITASRILVYGSDNKQNLLYGTLLYDRQILLHMINFYPKNTIYLLNDINSSLVLDEDEVYPIVTLKANTVNPPIHYTLSGDDADDFTINDAGVLMPKKPLLYADASDLNGDNIYDLSVQITDDVGHEKEVPLHITLQQHQYIEKETLRIVKDNERNLYFGTSLATDGNETLLVGSRGNAYLYKVLNDTLEKIVQIPNQSTATNSFGSSVAMTDNMLFIAAPREDVNDTRSAGAFYVYKYNDKNVTFQEKITAPEPVKYEAFGASMVTHNNTLFVGAPSYPEEPGSTFGKVFLYNLETNGSVSLEQTLTIPQTFRYPAGFGNSIAVTDKNLLIAASELSYNQGSWRGAVYLYKKDDNGTFEHVDTITSDSQQYESNFGNKVAMDGNYLLISTGSYSAKNVYLYKIGYFGEHAYKVDVLHFADSDTVLNVAVQGKDLFVAVYGYYKDEIQKRDILYHYVINDDDSVSLKEILLTHTDPVIASSYKQSIVTTNNFVAVGAPNSSFNMRDYTGAVTFYRKK